MNELIAQIGERHALAFVLVLGRVGPLFALAPLFSFRAIPVRARGIAAVAISMGLTPVALGGAELPRGVGPFAEVLFKEILIGLAFAFAIASVIAAIQVAGSFLDTFIGFSFGGLIDPLTGVQSTVLAQFYGLLGVMIFIAIGGDGMMIQGVARTYDLVALDEMPQLAELVGGATGIFVSIFGSALQVVAPVVIALIITDAAFGLVSRVVPQLNVFAVGFSAKIAVGFVVLAASLPFMGGWLGDEVGRSIKTIFDGMQVG